MRTTVVLPEVGAAVLRLSLWLAADGDAVLAGERLVEVLADAATFDVSSPATGRLVERRAWPGDRLTPGQVLGVIEAEGDA
jgi:pyruvate/2-oxoglutarate dehydrogenase complex dihydrolipoamide acyltransferase (E2) component